MKPYYKKFMSTVLSKYLLFTLINLLITVAVYAQYSDTSVYYFKHEKFGKGFADTIRVNTLAEADYFRVVYPSDKFHRFTINEYYTNGKVKSIGTTIAGINPYLLSSVAVQYDGDFAAFYPNGKRKSTVHFTNGHKDGDEYVFYPDGKIYAYIKNSVHQQRLIQFDMDVTVVKSLFWECYDKKGNMTCQNGDGEWVSYNSTFDTIFMHGPMKKGLRDGKWYGNTLRPDSIKYTYIYKKGEITDRVGYDKMGTAYPFDNINERADCNKGTVFSFLQSIRNHLKLPPGTDKPNIDTMHASFIIEKDGSISNFHVLGYDLSPIVKDAFVKALKPDKVWMPAKYYGIPFRTLMVLPFYVERYSTTKTNDFNYNPTTNKLQRTVTTTNTKSVYGSQTLVDF
jgi:hypothetical protein